MPQAYWSVLVGQALGIVSTLTTKRALIHQSKCQSQHHTFQAHMALRGQL